MRGALVEPVGNGMPVDLAVDEDALKAASLPRRSIEGRSGCGLCGVENIADVVRVTEPVLLLLIHSSEPTRQPEIPYAGCCSKKKNTNYNRHT